MSGSKSGSGAGGSPTNESGAERVAQVLDQAFAAGGSNRGGGGSSRKKPKGRVRRVVDELLVTVQLITDDTKTVYRYDAGAWKPVSDQYLFALVHGLDRNLSEAARRDAVARVRASTYRPNVTWGRVAAYEIPCANGVLDVLTGKLRPHRAEDLLERVLPIAWCPSAKCERWLEALKVYFPPEMDGGRTGALQEFFGYICLPHARYKKACFLYGKPDTGKSLAALLAKKLVGERFCCTLGVEHMDDPQRLAVIKGKALNVITEVSADALIADGGFKTLVSTEEPVFIDAKYRDPETYTPSAKHMIVGNSLPRLNDQTSATFDRLLIIPYDRVLEKSSQDRGLLAALMDELPGILVWAAEGARRLVQRGGQWPDVPAARFVLDDYRADLNPILQFVTENMRREAGAIVPLSRLATAFNRWNTGNRHFSVKYVGRLLRAAGFEDAIKHAKHEGRALVCLHGWRLIGEAPAQLYVKRRPKDPDDMIEVTEKEPVGPTDSSSADERMSNEELEEAVG